MQDTGITGIESLTRDCFSSRDGIVVTATRLIFPEIFELKDDTSEVHAVFLADARAVVSQVPESCRIRILERITSTAHSSRNDPPLVFVVKVQLVSSFCSPPPSKALAVLTAPEKKVWGGRSPTFMKKYVPFLSNQELAGKGAWHRSTLSLSTDTVGGFLEQHEAMTMLQKSTQSHLSHSYVTALDEFSMAQLDRQKATLKSNVGHQDAEGARKVTLQYEKALELALSQSQLSLSVELLCQWHSILVGNGLKNDAGQLRRKSVRVGVTTFARQNSIISDLETVCSELCALDQRLLQTPTPDATTRAQNIAIFAATVLFCIVDVHPFSDGNGRLSRIALNWALRRANVPFVVNLFATQQQKHDYTLSIRKTVKQLYLKAWSASDSQVLSAYRTSEVFLPIVAHVLSRWTRTVEELNKLVEEKRLLQTEQEQARAARLYRDKAAQGNCLICFEEQPNIATLCCGKAVHLNCIAEWLSQNSTCPQCRNELPRLPRFAQASSQQDENDIGNHQDTTTEESGSDVEDYDTTETTSQVEEAEDEQDTTDEMSEQSTASDGNDDTTEHQHDTRPPPQPQCVMSSCRNRSARDCSNDACGQCCIAFGYYFCERHA